MRCGQGAAPVPSRRELAARQRLRTPGGLLLCGGPGDSRCLATGLLGPLQLLISGLCPLITFHTFLENARARSLRWRRLRSRRGAIRFRRHACCWRQGTCRSCVLPTPASALGEPHGGPRGRRRAGRAPAGRCAAKGRARSRARGGSWTDVWLGDAAEGGGYHAPGPKPRAANTLASVAFRGTWWCFLRSTAPT